MGHKTPGLAPTLALFDEIAEKSPEERKIMALETIAEAGSLWIVSGIKSSDSFVFTANSMLSSLTNRARRKRKKRKGGTKRWCTRSDRHGGLGTGRSP